METIYPRRIVLNDEKLTRFLKEKNEMILEGRKVSEDIDAVQAEMDEIDKEVQAIEATVNADDLKAEADDLTKQFNELMDKMKVNQEKLRTRLLEIVPQDLRDKYDAKKKAKDELEQNIKKIALKVEKWKDKIIPRTRKLMSKYIENEWEDYDTIRIENGEVVATLFSHLEDFKTNFRNRKK